jgi:hypothetical protein
MPTVAPDVKRRVFVGPGVMRTVNTASTKSSGFVMIG